MPRYKDYDYTQSQLIPINFKKQILPDTFEYTINYLIDNHIDTSVFDKWYNNDETGAPAYDPAILLKIILYSFSCGIYTYRKIAAFCRENIIVKALSANTEPDYTTIANFMSSMSEEILNIFSDILLVCSELDLIGGEMFALDGCKMSSNASKEWSGKFADLNKKKEKFQTTIKFILEHYNNSDDSEEKKKRKKQINKIDKKVKKIEKFLSENEPKKGKRNKENQSNITDNESSKMKTSHGVLQGYNGMGLTDSKHQIIMCAEAFGSGQEQKLLKPMLEKTKDIAEVIGFGVDYLKDKVFIADTGSFSEENLKYLSNENIDAYVPDPQFRKRDPRFKTRERHRKEKKDNRFKTSEFIYDKENNRFLCPAGKYLKYERNQSLGDSNGKCYRSIYADCKVCKMKKRCLKTEKTRQRSIFVTDTFFGRNHSEEMMKKIDTPEGKEMYSKRMGIVEPVFGNIRYCKGLDRFTLRTKKKVNIQWNLFCIIHNIEKIFRYGDLNSLAI